MTALIPDGVVEACTRDHDRRDDSCEYCAVRATWQRCDGCDARWEDGDQVSGPTDHEHVICTDWWEQVLCPVVDIKTTSVSLTGVPFMDHVRCGDSVETGGNWHCDYHQRIVDADEAGRIHQRMAATR